MELFKKSRAVLYCIWLFILIGSIGSLSDCRGLEIESDFYARQGDYLKITIDARDANDLDKVVYAVNGIQHTIYTVPHTFWIDSCKYYTGDYLTIVNITGKAYYDDGEIKSTTKTIPLTQGSIEREDFINTYGAYVSKDTSALYQTVSLYNTEAFRAGFNSY